MNFKKNMRVLTYNLFVGPPCSRERRLEEQILFLQEINPSLLFLQEVYGEKTLRALLQAFPHHHAHFRRRWGPQTLWLSVGCLFLPPPFPLLPLLLLVLWALFRDTPLFDWLVGGVGGNLLLSKETYLRVGWTWLPPRGIDWLHPRSVLWADIVRGVHPLSVVGVHFSLDTSVLEESFRRATRRGGENVLLLGDTNAGREKMQEIEAPFRWLETGDTWVGRNPLTRGLFHLPDHVSDGIFLKGMWGEAETLEVHLSDHLPVVGRIRFTPPSSKCADSSTSTTP